MKIIGQGTQYSILDSSISIYSQLPAAALAFRICGLVNCGGLTAAAERK